MANQILQPILQKEVSRKDFLGILALATASVLGFGHLVKLLTGKSLDTHQALQESYGVSPYGGEKKHS